VVATHGPATSAAVSGVFEFENGDESENFNLKPLDDRHGPIPDDQRKISHEVYEARNTLKLLKEHGAFREGKGKASVAYNEFMGRVIQAAKAGCIGPNVDTKLAGEALEQIRADIMREKDGLLCSSISRSSPCGPRAESLSPLSASSWRVALRAT
jgi:hypothetical protein